LYHAQDQQLCRNFCLFALRFGCMTVILFKFGCHRLLLRSTFTYAVLMISSISPSRRSCVLRSVADRVTRSRSLFPALTAQSNSSGRRSITLHCFRSSNLLSRSCILCECRCPILQVQRSLKLRYSRRRDLLHCSDVAVRSSVSKTSHPIPLSDSSGRRNLTNC
jgi:hypothetical protein